MEAVGEVPAGDDAGDVARYDEDDGMERVVLLERCDDVGHAVKRRTAVGRPGHGCRHWPLLERFVDTVHRRADGPQVRRSAAQTACASLNRDMSSVDAKSGAGPAADLPIPAPGAGED
ncbi:hypothetical protein [Ornithinimicrobium kibberense]|uniref:hypothetical protein n=1 Tax=Ornithinimicrobium kibberense TaxID=282060 RepID=UPI00360A8F44